MLSFISFLLLLFCVCVCVCVCVPVELFRIMIVTTFSNYVRCVDVCSALSEVVRLSIVEFHFLVKLSGVLLKFQVHQAKKSFDISDFQNFR